MSISASQTKIQLAPSMMCADIMNLQSCIEVFEIEKIDFLHIDVMDGQFVPNYSLGTDYIKFLRAGTNIPLDLHLMVEKPEEKIAWFHPREHDIVSVHYESTPHIHRALQVIKSFGAHPMIALNPGTPISVIEDIIDDIDGILIMTVNPGFAGQKVIPQILRKVTKLRSWLDENGYHKDIEVDGNVSFENAPKMKAAGANVFVAGTSSIFSSTIGLGNAIRLFRQTLEVKQNVMV